MTPNTDETLLQRLENLRATARRLKVGDRRLILAVRNDIQTLRAALHRRSDELARELKSAGTQNKAVNAYSRTATMGRPICQPATRSSTPGATR